MYFYYMGFLYGFFGSYHSLGPSCLLTLQFSYNYGGLKAQLNSAHGNAMGV